MRIGWTEDAEEDIFGIFEYAARDKASDARSVVERIYRSVHLLETMPRVRRLRDDSSLRELTVTGLPYIVYYKEDSEGVLIVRVLHAALDWRPIQ